MAITATVRHQVRDYDRWRPAFDGHRPVREQHGCTDEAVYRGADDPNSICIVMQFPSRDAVLGFLSDPSLKTTMDSSGIVSEPVAVLGDILAPQTA